MQRIAMALAMIFGLTALGVAALWIVNHGKPPSYAAMSYDGRDPYQPPHDTGVMLAANGFYLKADQRRGAPHPTWFIPYWPLIVLAAAWPVWYGRRRVRERIRRGREVRGLCWCCGYDLRMTPERCPECGSSPRGVLARG